MMFSRQYRAKFSVTYNTSVTDGSKITDSLNPMPYLVSKALVGSQSPFVTKPKPTFNTMFVTLTPSNRASLP